jgi:hypothetical protein
MAVGALMQSWWLSGRVSAKLIERTAEKIKHWQQKNAKARIAHTKTTRRKLRKIGIKLTKIIRCKWT